MSKPVKEIIMRDILERLGDHEDAMVVSLRGIDSNSTNRIRAELRTKSIEVTVVRNALAKRAFAGTPLGVLEPVLTGQSAFAYGGESVVEVAREIVELVKQFPEIELKGAVLDGQLYEGEAGVTALSKFPTRDEAIAKVVTLVLSPGRNLLGQIKGPGGRLAGILKAIQDKHEQGEAIAKL